MTASRQKVRPRYLRRIGALLAQLFPNLAAMDSAKWMGIPVAILLVFGIIMGISDLLFGARVID